MNIKPIFFVALFFVSSVSYSQVISFDYYLNGNRKSRILDAKQVKPGTVNFPIKNTRSLRLLEDTLVSESSKGNQEIVLKEAIHENEAINALIYPNPTKGLLRMSIQNMPAGAQTDVRLYDLNGTELIILKDFGVELELDISAQRDGIYILRMKINELVFTWKIIKSNQ